MTRRQVPLETTVVEADAADTKDAVVETEETTAEAETEATEEENAESLYDEATESKAGRVGDFQTWMNRPLAQACREISQQLSIMG